VRIDYSQQQMASCAVTEQYPGAPGAGGGAGAGGYTHPAFAPPAGFQHQQPPYTLAQHAGVPPTSGTMQMMKIGAVGGPLSRSTSNCSVASVQSVHSVQSVQSLQGMGVGLGAGLAGGPSATAAGKPYKYYGLFTKIPHSPCSLNSSNP